MRYYHSLSLSQWQLWWYQNNAAMVENKNTNDYLQLIDDDVDNIKILGDQSNYRVKKDGGFINAIVDNIQYSDDNSQAKNSNGDDYLQLFENDISHEIDNDCDNAKITEGNLDQSSNGVTDNDDCFQIANDDYNSLQFTGNGYDKNNYEILKTNNQASLTVT